MTVWPVAARVWAISNMTWVLPALGAPCSSIRLLRGSRSLINQRIGGRLSSSSTWMSCCLARSAVVVEVNEADSTDGAFSGELAAGLSQPGDNRALALVFPSDAGFGTPQGC